MFIATALSCFFYSVTMLCVLAGDVVGSFSTPLKQVAALQSTYSNDDGNGWKWIDLYPPESKVLLILTETFF